MTKNAPSRKGREDAFIPRRLNILFAIVIILFSILISRLAYMQIINKDFYTDKLAKASQKVITNSSVRGQIYDAKGVALVENQVEQVATFTRSNKMTARQMKEIATKLLQWVSLTDVDVTPRERADYYLADPEVYAEVVSKLPKDQRLDTDGNSLDESTIYNNAILSLTEEQTAYSEEELKAIELFSQMNAAAYFETVNLVTDSLTAEQIARIAANEAELPGISTASSWKRVVAPTSLASIIGTVTTQQAGLPEEDAKDYLAKGYSLNDRVGTAYLEKQYEEVLQGQREKKEINLDRSGNVESITTIQEGNKGKNVKLTIDLAFQDGVNAILKHHFDSELSTGSARYSEGVYAVVLEPKTGAVLAMAGYSHDTKTNEVKENALGTVTNTFVPGSIVKGATLTAGWENGVISGNQVLVDQPIQFAGSAPINSWFTVFGNRNIDAVEALQYSSNTYMVQIALDMIGQPYVPGMILNVNETLKTSMEKLRGTFGEYGLGVATGIDLPLESTGFIPKDYSISNYLTNSFGQFDNYTPMQMAQYVATVANGGKRISPHLAEGIYANNAEGGLGEVIETITGRDLNQVNISEEEMGLIQQGFYRVVNGESGLTTGRTIADGASVSISAKTGTAETFVTTDTGQVLAAVNTNIVSYAPSSNPKIAVAVILPNLTDLDSSTSKRITTEIINLYQSLHPMN
ncbi:MULTISPECIES: penicillin-binding protein PBP2B [unclassified Streptococcus]|uniref:penicillin-binding protein PBP2B n=1 Tax=unclassified Streptococcus TaxID=2608887 RepID=UPI001ADDE223|nr:MULTISPECIES: penicillin-binding protein PBP2B [unclassified Streptococcus]MCQ9211012.1 penicillin-binding protein PBP2B [Streptococcus sp. B01]MCQ9214285.1 penicillin-binding protein PBP2B [Streptococcus sp. O1]